MCERSNGWNVVNFIDGRSYELNCNSYSCRECGPRKVIKLRKALSQYLIRWDKIRFWTFTISSSDFDSQWDHLNVLREAWQRLVTYLHRSYAITRSQRNFNYVKVFEPHKSGFFHLHCFINVFLPWKVVNNIWESICKELLSTDGHCAGSYVKNCPNAKFAAYYVSKYVLKSAQEISYYFGRYSTSRNIKLFPIRKSVAGWCVLNFKKDIQNQMYKFGYFPPALLEFFNTQASTSPSPQLIFDFMVPP